MDWSMMFNKRVVVYGCGNILKGDDGVGPAVVNYLEAEGGLPEDVGVLDIGTSIRQQLLDMVMMEPRPERIVIVDAVTEEGRTAGEFWEIDVDAISPKQYKDFSLHMFPTVNLLKDLKVNTGVDVRILAVQVTHVPDEIYEGLTPEVEAAVPAIAAKVRELFEPVQGK